MISSVLMRRLVIPLGLLIFVSGCSNQKAPSLAPEQANQTQSQAPQTSPPIRLGDLSRAVRDRNESEVRRLIAQGANPNERVGPESDSSNRLTPLHIAVLQRDPALVNILLNAGASPQSEVLGYQAIDLAIHTENDEIARVLVARLRATPTAEASEMEGAL